MKVLTHSLNMAGPRQLKLLDLLDTSAAFDIIDYDIHLVHGET